MLVWSRGICEADLKVLDMTRMDGLNDSRQLELLQNGNLKTLVLTGCSLKTLNASAFASLRQLEEVKSADSFAGLVSAVPQAFNPSL